MAPNINAAVSAELRSSAARHKVSGAQIAKAVDETQMWVSRRMSGAVNITVSDLVRLADPLGVDPRDVIAGALSSLEPLATTP